MRPRSLVYETAQVRATLTPTFQVKTLKLRKAFDGALSLRAAAEMAVVLRGVSESLPWLLV